MGGKKRAVVGKKRKRGGEKQLEHGKIKEMRGIQKGWAEGGSGGKTELAWGGRGGEVRMRRQGESHQNSTGDWTIWARNLSKEEYGRKKKGGRGGGGGGGKKGVKKNISYLRITPIFRRGGGGVVGES